MWIYPDSDPRQMPPLVLAYIGDAVYELYVRTYLLSREMGKVKGLHEKASALVRASRQADFLHRLDGLLTQEEKEVAKRGRNAKTASVPRGAQMTDYRLSTGFEALCGYLFLLKREDRISELLKQVFCEWETM